MLKMVLLLDKSGIMVYSRRLYWNYLTADKGTITIEKYDNANPPKFLPPHNEHGDFKLNVDAKTVDTVKINGQ